MPILLFVLSYLTLEAYVIARVWEAYGFVNLLFALLASMILGIGLIRNQTRHMMRQLNESMARGQMPNDSALQGLMIFIGGILFLIPGFVSDALALFFIVPGLRHLTAGFVRRQFIKRAAQGSFRVFTTMGGFAQRPTSQNSAQPNGWARDVSPKVIDVSPISSEHRGPKKN